MASRLKLNQSQKQRLHAVAVALNFLKPRDRGLWKVYDRAVLGGTFKVSPSLHSARTLRVRQHLTVRMQSRAFLLVYMEKICLTCSVGFSAKRGWQKFCTAKCRNNSPTKKLVTQAFQQSRRTLIDKIKVERGCSICGYKAHAAALDFNHIIGDKNFSISQDPKVALHKLLGEINKCEILCANCHRVHTYEHRHWQTKRKLKAAV